MSTLYLVLKKEWFDLIISGEKKEEYRDIKPHYVSRLIWKLGENLSNVEITGMILLALTNKESVDTLFDEHNFEYAFFKKVTFINGYNKNSRRATFQIESISIDKGYSEWGAVPGEDYFVIKLGQRLDGIGK